MAKLRVILFALLVMLCFSALAEADGEYWTLKNDLYYHYYRNCGNVSDMVPISRNAAEIFGKYPCPVCMPSEDDGSDIKAVTRGGTIVLRISDEWLYSFEDISGVFGFSMPAYYGGEDAWEALDQYLHGERLAAFLDDYTADGSAESIARTPAVLCTGGELLMNERHIGPYWYITVRPAEKFGSSWDMYWRVDEMDITMEADSEIDHADGTVKYDDVFSAQFNRQTIEDHKTVKAESMSSNKAGFTKEYDGLELQIFEGLDTNIGLIYEKNADKDLLENVEVRIGDRASFYVSGYMNGSNGVYVFVLTDAEVNAVKNENASVSIYRRPLTEDADFMDTPYAGVRKGSEANRSGIIDREGNFVVEPIYKSVSRPEPDSFRITGPRHFFVRDKDDNLIVLHGETLEKMFEVKKTGKYLNVAYMNPAVFKTFHEQGMSIHSMKDGSVLCTVLYGPDGNYSNNISTIDGYFQVIADGEPTRLVMNKGYLVDSESYLIDIENFERASESFNRITPLIWKGEKGVFLVEKHSASETKESFAGEYQEYYEYGSVYSGTAYGSSWRCGLMDEKGAIIAPAEYTSVEVISENEIRLGTADGSYKTIKLFE